LWRYTTVHAGRPSEVDPRRWLALLQEYPDQLEDIDKYIISFNMCDEAEQYQSYEQLWIENERSHSPAFQRELLQAMDLLSSDPLFQKSSHFPTIRQYVQEQYEQTNAWGFPSVYESTTSTNSSSTTVDVVSATTTASDSVRQGERDFQRIFEPSFRSASHSLYVNWAHIPIVHRHLFEYCLHEETYRVCVENFGTVKRWWDTICCGTSKDSVEDVGGGGPCPLSTTETYNTSVFPLHHWRSRRASLFVPITEKLSRNRGYLQCLVDGCPGVRMGERVDMSHPVDME
jgi:hypothetical protein